MGGSRQTERKNEERVMGHGDLPGLCTGGRDSVRAESGCVEVADLSPLRCSAGAEESEVRDSDGVLVSGSPCARQAARSSIRFSCVCTASRRGAGDSGGAAEDRIAGAEGAAGAGASLEFRKVTKRVRNGDGGIHRVWMRSRTARALPYLLR